MSNKKLIKAITKILDSEMIHGVLTEETLAELDRAKKRLVKIDCEHKNVVVIGTHPHKSENFIRCNDCGLEWID